MAPSNRQAINDEIMEAPVQSSMRDHLKGLQHDYAEDAIRRIHPDRWHALVNSLRAHQGQLPQQEERQQ